MKVNHQLNNDKFLVTLIKNDSESFFKNVILSSFKAPLPRDRKAPQHLNIIISTLECKRKDDLIQRIQLNLNASEKGFALTIFLAIFQHTSKKINRGPFTLYKSRIRLKLEKWCLDQKPLMSIGKYRHNIQIVREKHYELFIELIRRYPRSFIKVIKSSLSPFPNEKKSIEKVLLMLLDELNDNQSNLKLIPKISSIILERKKSGYGLATIKVLSQNKNFRTGCIAKYKKRLYSDIKNWIETKKNSFLYELLLAHQALHKSINPQYYDDIDGLIGNHHFFLFTSFLSITDSTLNRIKLSFDNDTLKNDFQIVLSGERQGLNHENGYPIEKVIKNLIPKAEDNNGNLFINKLMEKDSFKKRFSSELALKTHLQRVIYTKQTIEIVCNCHPSTFRIR